jgi:hypothetical protein
LLVSLTLVHVFGHSSLQWQHRYAHPPEDLCWELSCLRCSDWNCLHPYCSDWSCLHPCFDCFPKSRSYCDYASNPRSVIDIDRGKGHSLWVKESSPGWRSP